MFSRIQQVNQLIKKELGTIINKEAELPPGSVLTVTRAETASNLQEAKVYVSVMPDKLVSKTLRLLRQNVFYFQQLLNKRLIMRPVPKIIFIEEKKTAQAARIEELLAEIQSTNRQLPSRSSPPPPRGGGDEAKSK